MPIKTLPFAGAPLDLAETERSAQQLMAFSKQKNARAYIMHHGDFLVDQSGALIVLAPMKLVGQNLYDPGPLFLGLDGERPIFAFSLDTAKAATALVKGSQLVAIRGLASRLPAKELALIGRAKSLFDWHRFHKFCSTCGKESRSMNGGITRKCPSCSTDHFPRVNPVVIMLVLKDDMCLLGRGPAWPEGAFSALAGFVSPGESLEEACIREVKEEVGVDVVDPVYKFSQPWPFPSQLMIGMECRALSETITRNPAEIAEARWFRKADVRQIFAGESEKYLCPPDFTIAHHLLKNWLSHP